MAEYTVETALLELRPLLPNHQASIDLMAADSIVGFIPDHARQIKVRATINLYPIGKDAEFTSFKGPTLDDCMAQVKQWKAERDK